MKFSLKFCQGAYMRFNGGPIMKRHFGKLLINIQVSLCCLHLTLNINLKMQGAPQPEIQDIRTESFLINS